MFYKLDRNLWGILVAALLAAPSAQALTDDVAVQLLDRLNELEEEVTGLRGENELLRDKLQGVSTRQEELDRLRQEAEKAAAAVMPPAIEFTPSPARTESDPEISEDAPSVQPDADPLADIPPLESANEATTENQPAIAEKLLEEPAAEVAGPVEEPVVEAAEATKENQPTVAENPTEAATVESAGLGTSTDLPAVELVSPSVASSRPSTEPLADSSQQGVAAPSGSATGTPATEAAPLPVADAPPVVELKPAVATNATVQDGEKVDPNSTDSYYYYGTGGADTQAGAPAEVAAKTESNASDAAPAVAAETLTEHQVKTEYNQAYQLLVGNPAAAALEFTDFLKKYPNHELAANAQYWLAEALYAQRDYQNASQAFMTVLKQYKDSPKAPGAALKLGYSFYELSQWEYARRTLEDTVKFFPDSNAAKLAQERLQRMLKEGH